MNEDKKLEFLSGKLNAEQIAEFLKSAGEKGQLESLLKDAGASERQWLYASDPAAGDISYETLSHFAAGRLSVADSGIVESTVASVPQYSHELDAIKKGRNEAAAVADREFAPKPASMGQGLKWAGLATAAAVLGMGLYMLTNTGRPTAPATSNQTVAVNSPADANSKVPSTSQPSGSARSGSGGGGGGVLGGSASASSSDAKESSTAPASNAKDATAKAESKHVDEPQRSMPAVSEADKAFTSKPVPTLSDDKSAQNKATVASASTSKPEATPKPEAKHVEEPKRTMPAQSSAEKAFTSQKFDTSDASESSAKAGTGAKIAAAPAAKPATNAKAPVLDAPGKDSAAIAARAKKEVADYVAKLNAAGHTSPSRALAAAPVTRVASVPTAHAHSVAKSAQVQHKGTGKAVLVVAKSGHQRYVYVHGFRKRIVYHKLHGHLVAGYVQWYGKVKRWYPLHRSHRVRAHRMAAASRPTGPVASRRAGRGIDRTIEITTTGASIDRVPVDEDVDVTLDPAALDMYRERVALRNAGGNEEFELQYPVAEPVEDDQPMFIWQHVQGASRYQLDVDRLEGTGRVREFSTSTENSETRSIMPLLRGSNYSWAVTAIKDGQETRVGTRGGKEASFSVISSSAKEAIDAAKNDEVKHAAALAKAGLFEQAIEELNNVQQRGPSHRAEKVLSAIKAAVANPRYAAAN